MTVAACAALVQAGDPDRFLAAMAAPVDLRLRLFPLFALNLEVARAPFVTEEFAIAEMRLQWWRDAVEETANGKTPRAHEVAAPFAEVMRAADLPVLLIDQMIAARRWDIYDAAFEDAEHLDEHLDRTAGHLMWLGCLVAGADAGGEAAVRGIARAQGIANWLMAVPDLEARGRVPLVDGRPQAVRDLARDGLTALASAWGTAFGPAVPVLRTAWRARVILEQAAADPAAVSEGRLGTSEVRRRGSLMVRAALGRW